MSLGWGRPSAGWGGVGAGISSIKLFFFAPSGCREGSPAQRHGSNKGQSVGDRWPTGQASVASPEWASASACVFGKL